MEQNDSSEVPLNRRISFMWCFVHLVRPFCAREAAGDPVVAHASLEDVFPHGLNQLGRFLARDHMGTYKSLLAHLVFAPVHFHVKHSMRLAEKGETPSPQDQYAWLLHRVCGAGVHSTWIDEEVFEFFRSSWPWPGTTLKLHDRMFLALGFFLGADKHR